MTTLEIKRFLADTPVFTKSQKILIWLVGIFLCMVTAFVTSLYLINLAEKDFSEKADLIYDELTRRYSTLETTLTALAGFHQASDSVSTVQFTTFAQELLNAYPYIRSAISLRKLMHEDRAGLELDMHDLGYFQFSVSDTDENGHFLKASPRDEYIIIDVIEPLQPHMGSILGYDVMNDPHIFPALYQAVASGRGAASPATSLLQEEGGIMIFKAVYQGRYAPHTEEERLSMYTGAIAIEVGAKNLIENLAADSSGYSITLKQLVEKARHPFSATTSNSDPSVQSTWTYNLLYKRELDLYGQPTTLEISNPVNIFDDYLIWETIVITCVILTYIIIITTWSNTKHNRLHELELKDYALRAAFPEEDTDPIMRVGHDGTILYTNDPGKVIMTDWHTITGSNVPHDIHQIVTDALNKNTQREIELSVGDTHYTLRFLPKPSRNYVNIYGRDDTEQKQFEQKLLEAKHAAESANMAKSRFLATISHEVRTPLNGVLGMLELLNNTRLTPRQRKFTDTALRSGNNLLQLINDILDFSKIESNKLKLENIPYLLEDTVDYVLDMMKRSVETKNLKLVVDTPKLNYRLIGDELRLRQILLNLVGNAVKFTEQGEVIIRIVTSAEDANSLQLNIEVEDTGIGIARESLDSIFNDFTQQDDSTTRRFGGTGLGLTITKQLVNLMGGDIGVESTPGFGSLFWVTLPMKKQPRVHRLDRFAGWADETDDALSRGELNARILLAEDNTINQEVASAMLESSGCELTIVTNGYDAVEMMRKEPFDIVLMDCHMSGMDGFEAAKKIRELQDANIHTPIIAITADVRSSIRDQCEQAGMDDYLSKPFTQRAIYNIVRKWLPDKGPPRHKLHA